MMAREPVYPWDEWSDGRRWLLEAGEDFTVSLESFRAACYQAARYRNKRCRSKLHSPTELEIQFVPLRPPELERRQA